MNKRHFLFLSLLLFSATDSYAQFSAGVMGGVGHLWQRQVTSGPGTLIGFDAARPLLMGGVYGQYATNKKLGLLAGLQLRYQSQQQSQQFPAMNPANPRELTAPQYNRFAYLVATPYVGIRPIDNLEIAVGPDLSFLLQSRLIVPYHEPSGTILGYNVKATYWLNRLGLEGGYTRQTEHFDDVGTTQFYNSYIYAAIKYDLIRNIR